MNTARYEYLMDELGYLPFSQVDGVLLLYLFSKFQVKTSLIITTSPDFS